MNVDTDFWTFHEDPISLPFLDFTSNTWTVNNDWMNMKGFTQNLLTDNWLNFTNVLMLKLIRFEWQVFKRQIKIINKRQIETS